MHQLFHNYQCLLYCIYIGATPCHCFISSVMFMNHCLLCALVVPERLLPAAIFKDGLPRFAIVVLHGVLVKNCGLRYHIALFQIHHRYLQERNLYYVFVCQQVSSMNVNVS